MKKLLLVTAAVVALATPALAKGKPAPVQVPSIAMTTTLIEKSFTNADCVAHAKEVLLVVKKNAPALEINDPQDHSIFAGDSELSLMIDCDAEVKTVVFVVTSVAIKADKLSAVVKMLDTMFTGGERPAPSENGKHWSD